MPKSGIISAEIDDFQQRLYNAVIPFFIVAVCLGRHNFLRRPVKRYKLVKQQFFFFRIIALVEFYKHPEILRFIM